MRTIQPIDFLDIESTSGQHRPWKRYWPPKEGTPLFEWFQAELPEVLTWRYDPKRPFAKPWQEWKQKMQELGKVCPPELLSPQSPDPTRLSLPPSTRLDCTTDIDSCEVVSAIDEQQEAFRKEASEKIFREVRDLGLPFCRTDSLQYLIWDPRFQFEKPFRSRVPFLEGLNRSNVFGQSYGNVSVYDVSGFEDHFTLERSGFRFLQIPIDIQEWTENEVEAKYLPFMESWLKQYFGSELVKVYAYNFRGEKQNWLGPFTRAHCDITPNSSVIFLKLALPEQAADIQKKRYRFVNIWRPLTGPYQDSTLALCDYRSVRQTDLVAADIVFPHYCNEGYDLKYSPHHQWFYKRGMSLNDVALIKLYDSDSSEATFCPHSAFMDPSVPPGTPVRASIEFRAIIVD